MMIKEKTMHQQNLHKNLSYNTFVQTLMIEQNEMMTDQVNITTDDVVEVHHETIFIQKTTLQISFYIMRLKSL